MDNESQVAYWPTRERNPLYQPILPDSSMGWLKADTVLPLVAIAIVVFLGIVLVVLVRKRKRDSIAPVTSVNTSPAPLPQSSSGEKSGVSHLSPVQPVSTAHNSISTRRNMMKRSQRDVMRALYRKHGNIEEVLVSLYAEAEKNGEVDRKSNDCHLGAEGYARALYADGVRKGWITET